MQGNMHVRYLDWAEAIAMEGAQTAQNTDSSNVVAAAANHAAADSSSQQQAKPIAPHVQSDETFDVIIGTDIMYEVSATPCTLSVLTHLSLYSERLAAMLSLAGMFVMCQIADGVAGTERAGTSFLSCSCCAAAKVVSRWTSCHLLRCQRSGKLAYPFKTLPTLFEHNTVFLFCWLTQQLLTSVGYV